MSRPGDDGPVLRTALLSELIAHHRGAVNGVHARDLALRLSCEERTLRSAITALREDGEPIVARPETGYFLAESPDEIRSCCAFLRSRAMRSLQHEARLRRISLPELLGQLHLNT